MPSVKTQGERGPEVWAKCILTSGLLKRYLKDGHFYNYSPHKENKLMKRGCLRLELGDRWCVLDDRKIQIKAFLTRSKNKTVFWISKRNI